MAKKKNQVGDFFTELEISEWADKSKNWGRPTEMYGFKVGDIIRNKVPVVKKYTKKEIPAGTKMILVSITPKVYLVSKEQVKEDPARLDRKTHFFNATLYSEGIIGERLREDFVTIEKWEDITDE